MKIKKKFFISKNVIFLGLVSLFTDISTEMITPLLPLFLSDILRTPKSFIGLIEGVAEATASILKFFSGYISDKLKKRKFIVTIGYGLSSITKPFFGIVSNAYQVLFIRFMDRVGKGIRTSPRDALIADSISKEEHGKAFGFHRAMDTLGAVIGPFLAFIFLPYFNNNYRSIFLLSAIPAFIAVLIIILFVRESKKIQREKREIIKISFMGLPKEFKFFIFFVILFTLGNSSDAFLILRASSVGINSKMIPILWVFFNIVYTIFSTPFGILSDKYGRKSVITLGLLVYSLVYAGFAFASKPIHIWCLFLTYGIYYAMVEGNFRAYVADIVPSRTRGTAYGIFHTGVGIALLPASLIMGILWEKLGVKVAFLFGSVLAIISSLGLISIRKR